jgi:hypothetical protein
LAKTKSCSSPVEEFGGASAFPPMAYTTILLTLLIDRSPV